MQQSIRTSTTQPGPRWGALRAASLILKILAWLVLLGGLAFAAFTVVGILNQTTTNIIPGTTTYTQLPIAIGSVIGAIINFIFLYAFAELIMLFITIEKNTRNKY